MWWSWTSKRLNKSSINLKFGWIMYEYSAKNLSKNFELLDMNVLLTHCVSKCSFRQYALFSELWKQQKNRKHYKLMNKKCISNEVVLANIKNLTTIQLYFDAIEIFENFNDVESTYFIYM